MNYVTDDRQELDQIEKKNISTDHNRSFLMHKVNFTSIIFWKLNTWVYQLKRLQTCTALENPVTFPTTFPISPSTIQDYNPRAFLVALTFSFLLKNLPSDDLSPFFLCAAAAAALAAWLPPAVMLLCSESWLLWREDRGEGGVENPPGLGKHTYAHTY